MFKVITFCHCTCGYHLHVWVDVLQTHFKEISCPEHHVFKYLEGNPRGNQLPLFLHREMVIDEECRMCEEIKLNIPVIESQHFLG